MCNMVSQLMATSGAAALLFVSAVPLAGAVAHPRLSSVTYSGHQVVVQAAEQIRLDKSAGSKNDGKKKCVRACGQHDSTPPSD